MIVRGRCACKIYSTGRNVFAIDFKWRSHASAYMVVSVDDTSCIRDIVLVDYGGFVIDKEEEFFNESVSIVKKCLSELLYYSYRENKTDRYIFFDNIYSAFSYKSKGGEIRQKKTFRNGCYRPYFYNLPTLKNVG